MTPKIIILEDNLYTAEDIYDEIRYILRNQKNEIELIVVNSIDEANAKLKQINPSELKCLIVDLNMSPAGLSDDEKRETQGATLTGWIWVLKYIIKKAKFKKTNIIFYSAFASRLKSDSQYRQLSLSERSRLTVVDKNEHGMSYLYKKVLNSL